MKYSNYKVYKFIVIIGLLFMINCEQIEYVKKPKVKTVKTENTKISEVEASGEILEFEESGILSYGFCWAETENPKNSDNAITLDLDSLKSIFKSTISGLETSKTYYIRAFATNEAGMAYGENLSFSTTDGDISVSTVDVSNITSNSAICGGEIADDGGAEITARGVCWSTNEDPTLGNLFTTNSIGTGAYTSTIEGLIPNTQYYIKAYATNKIGTKYGAEKIFTTINSPYVPALNTKAVFDIGSAGASSGGEITSDNGFPIIEKGICYGESSLPTVDGNKIQSIETIDDYISVITGLEANKTYYIRAYAINSEGIGYGNEVEGTTAEGEIEIGDNYAGGIIFYLDGVGGGMVCAKEDNGSRPWGCNNVTIGGTLIDFGSGQNNSQLIITGCTTNNIAADICLDLVLDGFDDWFLPSKDELFMMYENLYLNGFGGFNADIHYHSSSEVSKYFTWLLLFSDGSFNQYLEKYKYFNIRAVRVF